MLKQKIKFISLCVFFFFLILIFILASSLKAQEDTSINFPINEAGISAYIKATDVTPEKIAQIPFETIEKQGKTFVYGKYSGFENPYLYIGLDGWIVAYYKREEPRSKILNLRVNPYNNKLYFDGNKLERTIGSICSTIFNSSCIYPIKYFDFEFPQAKKMTFVGEKIGYFVESPSENDFLISGFGKIYNASYQLQSYSKFSVLAELNGQRVFEKNFEAGRFYENFPLEIFSSTGDQGTKIIIKRTEGSGNALFGMVAIYDNER